MPTPSLLFSAAALLLLPWLARPRPRPPVVYRGLQLWLWRLNRLYCVLWHRLDAERFAPLPETGPAILIANHTCGIDPALLVATCRRRLGFLIAREFYDAWYCRTLCRMLGCIPVKRDGHDLAATRAALRALEEGNVVPIFPEGRIRPTSGREIGPGHPGVAYIALRSGAPVFPAYISGTPETKIVPLAVVIPSSARVVFGPPVDLSDFTPEGPADKDALERATARMMAAIVALRDREARR